MINTKNQIWLASVSPRRKKLLEQIRLSFKTVKVDIDESIRKGETPVKAVKRLSLEKMIYAKEKIKNGIIITADTIVVLNNKIIGKPFDENDAVKILQSLSGKTHWVFTGFCIINLKTGSLVNDYEKTAVTFRKLEPNEIVEYVKTGSPIDKAGAYGIQDDFGAVFIKKINGCYYNVVGLPLPKVYSSLKKVI